MVCIVQKQELRRGRKRLPLEGVECCPDVDPKQGRPFLQNWSNLREVIAG
jgi:hypothetical protein